MVIDQQDILDVLRVIAERNRLKQINTELLAALTRIVGLCKRYLEERLPSDAELADSKYIDPLEQACTAITNAERIKDEHQP